MSLVVRINGWPGTGKLTIARLLAAKLDARLLDNHTLLNPASALFERSDHRHAELRLAVRKVVLDYAADLPATTKLIFTDALSNDDFDSALFMQYAELAAKRRVRLATVVLDISLEENISRIVAPGRAAHRKLTSPSQLQSLRTNYELARPADAIVLDVTRLAAEEAANELARRLNA